MRRVVRAYVNLQKSHPIMYVRAKFSAQNFLGVESFVRDYTIHATETNVSLFFGREHHHFVTWHNKCRRNFAEIRSERYPILFREKR